MPIIIPKKQGASNKPHIPPKIPHDQPEDESDASSKLTPFIDRITINITPPDKDQHDIYSAFWTVVGDPEVLADATSAEKKAAGSGFNVAKRVVIPSVDDPKKRPTLFVRHVKEGKRISKLRLDFVPVDLGNAGMFELHLAINMIVPDGWEYVVKHGRVTRLDVAVDLYGLTMDSLHFVPKKTAHTTRLFPSGHLETIYFGKPKSRQTVIYDRSKKRAAHGQAVAQSVRVERRMRLSSLKLANLPKVANPFGGTAISVGLPQPPSSAKQNEWALFSDSVEKRGLTAALALLPKDRAQAYKVHVLAHKLPEWSPEAIWEGWLPMLDELGIAKASW